MIALYAAPHFSKTDDFFTNPSLAESNPTCKLFFKSWGGIIPGMKLVLDGIWTFRMSGKITVHCKVLERNAYVITVSFLADQNEDYEKWSKGLGLYAVDISQARPEVDDDCAAWLEWLPSFIIDACRRQPGLNLRLEKVEITDLETVRRGRYENLGTMRFIKGLPASILDHVERSPFISENRFRFKDLAVYALLFAPVLLQEKLTKSLFMRLPAQVYMMTEYFGLKILVGPAKERQQQWDSIPKDHRRKTFNIFRSMSHYAAFIEQSQKLIASCSDNESSPRGERELNNPRAAAPLKPACLLP